MFLSNGATLRNGVPAWWLDLSSAVRSEREAFRAQPHRARRCRLGHSFFRAGKAFVPAPNRDWRLRCIAGSHPGPGVQAKKISVQKLKAKGSTCLVTESKHVKTVFENRLDLDVGLWPPENWMEQRHTLKDPLKGAQ